MRNRKMKGYKEVKIIYPLWKYKEVIEAKGKLTWKELVNLGVERLADKAEQSSANVAPQQVKK